MRPLIANSEIFALSLKRLIDHLNYFLHEK